MMARENPGAADRYQQAKHAAAQVGRTEFQETETQSWEEFRETMDEDFWPAFLANRLVPQEAEIVHSRHCYF